MNATRVDGSLCRDPECAECARLYETALARRTGRLPQTSTHFCDEVVFRRTGPGGAITRRCSRPAEFVLQSGERRCLQHASRAALVRRVRHLQSRLALLEGVRS